MIKHTFFEVRDDAACELATVRRPRSSSAGVSDKYAPTPYYPICDMQFNYSKPASERVADSASTSPFTVSVSEPEVTVQEPPSLLMKKDMSYDLKKGLDLFQEADSAGSDSGSEQDPTTTKGPSGDDKPTTTAKKDDKKATTTKAPSSGDDNKKSGKKSTTTSEPSQRAHHHSTTTEALQHLLAGQCHVLHCLSPRKLHALEEEAVQAALKESLETCPQGIDVHIGEPWTLSDGPGELKAKAPGAQSALDGGIIDPAKRDAFLRAVEAGKQATQERL